MESHEGLTTQAEAAVTISELFKGSLRSGRPAEFPGATIEKNPVESRYRVKSGGAYEIIDLIRDEQREMGPLVTLIQNDSQQEGRTYEFKVAALKEGILHIVRYGKNGEIADVEVVGPWKQKTKTAEALGYYNLEKLPKKINSAKLAGEIAEEARMFTFKTPDIMGKSMDPKISELKPIKSPAPAGKAPVRNAA